MYTVSKILGGGESYWYLVSSCGRIVDLAHERDEHGVNWLFAVAKLLNATASEERNCAA